MYAEIALAAYIIDMLIGELPLIPHPVVIMGKIISVYEKLFYKDSVIRGALLTVLLVSATFLTVHLFSLFFRNNLLILSVAASTTLASNMLFRSVREIITSPEKIKYLVSRDTENLPVSEIYKAAVETYAENLSDGVIAPLFYLTLFGLEGAFVYKAINTLDSMIGYRTQKYEKFGKTAALLDDAVNFIPARITALIICLLFLSFKSCRTLVSQAKGHASPNAGYPIAAMGLALKIKLGGDTSYHGKIKHKPFFGSGRKHITAIDVMHTLSLKPKLDFLIITLLASACFFQNSNFSLSFSDKLPADGKYNFPRSSQKSENKYDKLK